MGYIWHLNSEKIHEKKYVICEKDGIEQEGNKDIEKIIISTKILLSHCTF